MKFLNSFILFVMLFASFAPSSFANPQKELERYYKCYSHMVRERPAQSDPRVIKIKSNTLTGVDACMEILNQANLDPQTGYLSGARSGDQDTGPTPEYQGMEVTFGQTLHPYLRSQKCTGCHAVFNPTPHSHSDLPIAHSAVQRRVLVNFSNPANSRIYTKIAGGHQCSGDECTTLKNGILAKINEWKTAYNGIDLSQFKTNNGTQQTGDPYPRLGQRVLKTFNDLHRSWIGVNEDFRTVSECSSEMHDIMDSGIVGYYVTRSLFTQKPYSYVVTTDEYVKGLRYSNMTRSPRSLMDPQNIRVTDFAWGHPRNPDTGKVDYNGGFPYPIWENPPLVELGKIVGVTSRGPEVMPREPRDLESDVDIFKTEGGALGAPPYVILNHGMGSRLSNGAMDVPRRWSRAVLNDFLCRDVPVIRASDAMTYLDKQGQSELPFRHGIACMKCHATMDTMARANRNARQLDSVSACRTADTQFMFHYGQSQPEHEHDFEGWIDTADNKYFRRPPNGKFLFRSQDGSLIDRDILGKADLGQVISETDDYYMCAAKRYLQFFTGIDIPMFDEGDLNAPPLNSKETEYLNFVKSLGQELKQHQDLKKVIKRIIASEVYMKPGTGAAK